VKLGDANTKFFHTKATINYRHNYIAMLKNDSLVEITDHDSKAAILWNAFKEIMRKTGSPDNLDDMVANIIGPELSSEMEAPFADKEIDDVVKNLPNGLLLAEM
jgi:hypothetical protein